MIEPVKMKPHNQVSFGANKTMQDPLNATASYRKVVEDNKKIVEQEALKMQAQTGPDVAKKLDSMA